MENGAALAHKGGELRKQVEEIVGGILWNDGTR
jgi:hypothetical protein